MKITMRIIMTMMTVNNNDELYMTMMTVMKVLMIMAMIVMRMLMIDDVRKLV